MKIPREASEGRGRIEAAAAGGAEGGRAGENASMATEE